jgi:hypothetical protein
VIVFVASIGILSALGDATPIGPLLNEPLFERVSVPNVDEVTEAVEGPRTQLQVTGGLGLFLAYQAVRSFVRPRLEARAREKREAEAREKRDAEARGKDEDAGA